MINIQKEILAEVWPSLVYYGIGTRCMTSKRIQHTHTATYKYEANSRDIVILWSVNENHCNV